MNTLGEAAIAEARAQSQDGTTFAAGLCLQRVRLCYQIGPRYLDATEAWRNASHQHPETDPRKIPRGVPVFWTGGSEGHGHVAIATGDGYCWSTDILRRGRWDKVPIPAIRQKWGLPLAGWTEDLNGVLVYATPDNQKEEDMTPEELLRAKLKGAGDRYVATVLVQTWSRTARLEAALTALATSMGPTVEKAVQDALADAVVDVDVNVNTDGGQS